MIIVKLLLTLVERLLFWSNCNVYVKVLSLVLCCLIYFATNRNLGNMFTNLINNFLVNMAKYNNDVEQYCYVIEMSKS